MQYCVEWVLFLNICDQHELGEGISLHACMYTEKSHPNSILRIKRVYSSCFAFSKWVNLIIFFFSDTLLHLVPK